MIGSGVAGLSDAYLLSQRYRVTCSEDDVPSHSGAVIDRGLWAWTRRPDYFGDACVWWGLWLVTITGWGSLATVGSPLLMTYFLVCASGARRTEMYMGWPPRSRRIQGADRVFRPAPATIGAMMTTVAVHRIGYRSMTGAPRLSTDLDVLLRRVACRDADAFAAFYDHTSARVYGLVARVLRDPGYSEETAQEVYLQVWQTAGGYNAAKGSALSWLMTIAHRRAVDRVRAEQAASQRESRYGAATIDPPGDVVADCAIAADERRRVTECLDGLTEVQRQCIDMAYYGGLTYTEVAQQLSANLSTIKSRMRDALRGLRNCLGMP